jgi:hypothetical protein
MSTQRPTVHSVHIYDDDSGLITRLCGIFSAGLRMGDSALVIATADHRDRLVTALEQTGLDVRSCAREGRYTMLDANELLAMFMRNSVPDPVLFSETVGNILVSAHKRACSRHQGVTVFGEMVAVLWNGGEKEAALKLEQLWNDAMGNRSFHLHCAYPRGLFHNNDEINSVHSMHTHVLQ